MRVLPLAAAVAIVTTAVAGLAAFGTLAALGAAPAAAAPGPAPELAPAPAPRRTPSGAAAPAQGSPGAARVTEPFRREHAQLRIELEHAGALVASLASAAPEARRAAQDEVIGFLSHHILPHATWEEAALYPAVDRRASRGEPFTATMRFEHTVVKRWSDALAPLARDPDPSRFMHAADRLLGLITAHFEAEEQVLLPVLDRTMTAAEYERELGTTHHQETR